MIHTSFVWFRVRPSVSVPALSGGCYVVALSLILIYYRVVYSVKKNYSIK